VAVSREFAAIGCCAAKQLHESSKATSNGKMKNSKQ